MALVMGTTFTLSVSLIVAMAMKDAFVTQFLPSTEAPRRNVIDFHNVLIFEEQFTPLTFALLFSEQDSQCSTEHVMVAESLTPIQKVSIIWASCSLHFGVSLDMRMAMIP
ncbi:hypothetical protein KSX_85990 [Ktedonospora formicarum]|uniref:Uncharacterized protein n=1 Tax=Ktedonospora formicarum TaxID=2778364 RepID=A0A8J3I882_9CHLR|nr:hypothetical protein KSX_85990 [Ktedonospora formicarum]